MSAVDAVSDSQWEEAVLKSETPVLVDFWASWCGPCKAMEPYVDKLADEMGDRLKVLKLNTEENQQTPASYGVTGIPTFLLVVGGEVKAQLVGSMTYDALKSGVEKHL
jgi:thioredoxin 1